MRKGTKSLWKFTRMPSGAYRFVTRRHRTFEVTQASDGTWYAEEIGWLPSSDDYRGHEVRSFFEPEGTTYATRTDAAAACEWVDRDFWEWHERYLRGLV